MNPLEFFKWCYLENHVGAISALFLQVMLICMVVLSLSKSWLDRGCDQVDAKWSRICGTLINRIDRLMPQYQKAMRTYAKETQKSLRASAFVDVAQAIPRDVKLQAERDLCLHDLDDSRTTTSIRLQTASLLTTQHTHTQATNDEGGPNG
jgi:hypothetical protein